jgi:hypothetical protein
MHSKWSIYYLLYKISEQNDPKQASILSPIDTVFKARENTKPKPKMDIEPSQNPIQNPKINNFTKKELKPEPDQSFMKGVQKVANKGNPNIDLSEADLLRDILFAF